MLRSRSKVKITKVKHLKICFFSLPPEMMDQDQATKVVVKGQGQNCQKIPILSLPPEIQEIQDQGQKRQGHRSMLK